MIILGVDPGTAICGYGIIKKNGQELVLIDYGCIKTDKADEMPKRLSQIRKGLVKVIKEHRPDCLATEDIFFFKNQKTAVAIGQAKGVIMLTGFENGLPVCEYTPLQVKQSISGYGRADKKQVQEMVKILLKMKEIPKPDDASDALAIAICHANSERMNKLERDGE